jgi:hypothetical protein
MDGGQIESEKFHRMIIVKYRIKITAGIGNTQLNGKIYAIFICYYNHDASLYFSIRM